MISITSIYYLRYPLLLLGPSTWKDLAPDAAGQHQSPVNINTTDAIYDKELPANPLQCSHEGSVATTILNNGHTFMVNFANENTSKYKIENSITCFTLYVEGRNVVLL